MYFDVLLRSHSLVEIDLLALALASVSSLTVLKKDVAHRKRIWTFFLVLFNFCVGRVTLKFKT